MTGYLIALDQSTQSTKAFLYDQSGKPVAAAKRRHAQLIDDRGWISHDLDEIYRNVQLTVEALFEQKPEAQAAVVGIGITNQRETVAAWSRRDGHALGDAVVWQCARATPQCQRIRQVHPEAEAVIEAATGLPLSPFFPAAKMRWLLEEVPAVQAAAATGDLCLGTIDSWLLYRLTQGKVFATEPSNASRTQLFNLQDRRWDPELLELFGLEARMLPEVLPSDSAFGLSDCAGLLPNAVPIHGILGDSQAALYGQGGSKPGALKATYGTGSSIMVNVGETPVRSQSGLVTSIGWEAGGRCQYVLEGNVNYAGALVTWLQDSLGLIAAPDEVEGLALKANPHDRTVIVPAFTGLGAPYWQPNAQAAILNMAPTTRKAEVVKAALDAIAFQITAIITAMKADAPVLADAIKVDGGSTGNAYLMQLQSDLTALNVEVAAIEDISAFGVAMLAGRQVGLFDQAQGYLTHRRYQPQMAEAERKQRLSDWQQAVATVTAQAARD